MTHFNHLRDRTGSSEPLLISIVVPCCDEGQTLAILFDRYCCLASLLCEEYNYDTELVLVDDGSRDGTWLRICGLVSVDQRVRGIRLSRNFGHQAALSCAYEHARGNAIVSLDADGQDPPEVVPEMVKAWREGAEVVFAVRELRVGESRFKRATAWLFYLLMNKLGARHVRRNVGDFRLLDRRALRVMLDVCGCRPFFRDAAGWIGFATAEVSYERHPRCAGETKYTFGRMCRLALDGLVSSSLRPLHFSWCAAAFPCGLAIAAFLAPSILQQRGAVVTIIAICCCAVVILIGQGIQGLYLARIYEECLGRPRYVVAERIGGSQNLQTEARENLASCPDGKCRDEKC